MKILFILPEYYPHSGGGISTYYLHYIKALKPYCERIKVIVGSGYLNKDERFDFDGIEVEYLNPALFKTFAGKFTKHNIAPEFKQNLAAAWAMYEQSNGGEGFDIVECTEFGFGFVPWVIEHPKPVITRLHGSSGQIAFYETYKTSSIAEDFIKQAELLLLPHCDRLLTHSLANLEFWNGQFGKKMVSIIPPVFEPAKSAPVPFSQRCDFGLVTARIQQWKGPVEVCGAVSKLSATERPVIKWFGRDMPYSDTESTAQFLKKNFQGVWNTSILPQKPIENAKIIKIQQNAKFGLVPSTWDMFNFTLIEFMAAGTPVICADGAGSSWLIEHGRNGLKYPATDESALAECIMQLNKMDERAYMQMAMAGMETVTRELSGNKIIPQNLEHYQSIITNFKRQGVDVYTSGVYCPDEKNYTIESVLDKQPLKLLLNYSMQRLKASLWKR